MNRITRLFAFAVLAAGLFFASSGDASLQTHHTPEQQSRLVLTDCGPVRGFQAGRTFAFLGIPYAAPPVGPLRWQPPAPPNCWDHELQATSFGPPCPQTMAGGGVIGAEDCLTLNVWMPLDADTTPNLPVMVFIHGGGNTQGSSSVRAGDAYLYDGQLLADRGRVIVVTSQYRLGALGFLAHPILTAESDWGGSGNYGLLDQIDALQWVQRNIPNFGGDPSRVMIFGESAGAVDTCMMMGSPLAAGLFSRALMQSGGCSARTLAERMAEGVEFAAEAGCGNATDPVACLRGLDQETIVTAVDNAVVTPSGTVTQKFGPNVDGTVLPEAPLEAIRNGRHNRVPFAIGANADETAAFGILPLTERLYREIVIQILGPVLGERALAEYPVSEYGSPRNALIAMTTDAQFVCPSRTIARAATSSQQEPVFRYFFTHRLSGLTGSALGAFHGLELFFVFQRLGLTGNYDPTRDDIELQAAILGYWTRFATTGDPHGLGAVNWPRYAVGNDLALDLGTPITVINGVRTEKCDFWDRISAGQ